MKRHKWFAAFLALSAAALGQEPKEERVEVKVIGPTGGIQVLQNEDLDEVDVDDADLSLEKALGSVILGVQGQDAKEGKAKKQDDGTIVREFDLGGGSTLKIIITTKAMKGEGEGEKGHEGHHLLRRARPFTWIGPEGDQPGTVKVITPEGMKTFTHEFKFDPHGFDVKAFGGEVKEHMDRALRAFDRAREEFIRAYNEGVVAAEANKADSMKGEIAKMLPKLQEKAKADVKAKAEKIEAEVREKVEGARKEKAEAERKEKGEAERKEKGEYELKKKLGDVQFLGVSPGAASKQAREVEELRKEIKELEKMVRDLKDQIEKKKGE